MEWKPTFTAGQPSRPVALLQLATAGTCVVLQMRQVGWGPALESLLR